MLRPRGTETDPRADDVAPDAGEIVDGLAIDHVVSRGVRDSAAALDAAAGGVEGDPYWAPPAPASYLEAIKRKPKRLKIAFSTRKLDGAPLHADCVAAVKAAANCARNSAMTSKKPRRISTSRH